MKSEKRTVVLIVGDSFIDENWLMSRGYVYHSYNVGKEHYISNLKSADSKIISFCGAASLWRILCGPDDAQTSRASAVAGRPEAMSKRHNLILLSAWNPKDGDLLQCMLCGRVDASRGLTPYRISGLIPPQTSPSKGRTICPYDKKPCKHKRSMFNLVKRNDEEAASHTSTNRLIRLYEGFGSDQPYLKSRFDWRLELSDDYKNYGIVNEIKDRIHEKKVEAIVVVDHGYGVSDKRSGTSGASLSQPSGWSDSSKGGNT
jgi:hypothetical protein